MRCFVIEWGVAFMFIPDALSRTIRRGAVQRLDDGAAVAAVRG